VVYCIDELFILVGQEINTEYLITNFVLVAYKMIMFERAIAEGLVLKTIS